MGSAADDRVVSNSSAIRARVLSEEPFDEALSMLEDLAPSARDRIEASDCSVSRKAELCDLIRVLDQTAPSEEPLELSAVVSRDRIEPRIQSPDAQRIAAT